MLIYFLNDGTRAVELEHNPGSRLAYAAVRIVEVRRDGAVLVHKDRFGYPCELIGAIPPARAPA